MIFILVEVIILQNNDYKAIGCYLIFVTLVAMLKFKP
jgi:hypothetical protein